MSSAIRQPVVWDPQDYAAHSSAQQVWAHELIERLNLAGNEQILDVGCGDGKVTAQLARAVSQGSVVGVDTSKEMIGFARGAFPEDRFANLTFRQMDARRLRFNCSFDLVFSSSVLHWVDDHPAFLRGASECLRSGGRLMVSCGGKGNAHDVFLALRPEMRLKQWSQYFRKLEPPYFFHSPEDYKKWLPRFGFEPRIIRLVPKDAVHQDRNAFAAWFRTTWLPYTQRVPEALREEFIAGVVDRYLHRHPTVSNGSVRVRMVRLEIDALKV